MDGSRRRHLNIPLEPGKIDSHVNRVLVANRSRAGNARTTNCNSNARLLCSINYFIREREDSLSLSLSVSVIARDRIARGEVETRFAIRACNVALAKRTRATRCRMAIRGCVYYILLDDSVQIAFAERPILPASERRRVTVIARGKFCGYVHPEIFI